VSAGDAVLERVKVSSQGLDPTLARLRLEHMLAAGAWHPPGLPPAAVLCVRRLADPRPGTLSLRAGGERPPPEWERAFASALEGLLRWAARPAHEAVPANAEAVLFADQAEMMACLARDRSDGATWTRWWWRSLISSARGGPDPEITVWLERPEHASAALALLATREEAVKFAATIPAPAAIELAARVAAAFAAPALRAAILAPVEERPADRARAGPEALDPPWRQVAPAAATAPLQPEQQLMLGTLLMLRHAVGVARTRAFAAHVHRWRVAVARPRSPAWAPSASATMHAPESAPAGPVPNRAADVDVRSVNDPDAARRPGSAPRVPRPRVHWSPLRIATRAPGAPAVQEIWSDRRPPSPPAPGVGEVPQPFDGPSGTPHAQEPGRPVAPAPTPTEHARESTAESVPPPAAPAPALRAGLRSEAAAPRTSRRADGDLERRRPAEPVAAATVTRLGGLFYLVNLALYLDLYSDFTRPREPGITLNPWELVELLGARLLGRRPRDPVWALLRELAGRPRGQPVGRGFRPPRAWRVAPRWLGPFDHDGVWRWSTAGGTLRVLHPGCFTVIAVPRTTAPPNEQLRRELKRLASLSQGPARTSLPREPKRPLARWIARLGAYARARLRLALGHESPAAILLEHSARVHVTPSHVDVVLRLAELPVEIRLAGLDRDPGWIPAAGRYLAFHFE